MEKIKTFWKHATSMQKGMLLVGSVVVLALIIALFSPAGNKVLGRNNNSTNDKNNATNNSSTNDKSDVDDGIIITFKEPREAKSYNNQSDYPTQIDKDGYHWQYGYFEFASDYNCSDSITDEDVELMRQYEENKEKAIASNLDKYNNLWEKVTKCYQDAFDMYHKGEDLSLLTERELENYKIPNPYDMKDIDEYYKDNKIKLEDEKDYITELIKAYMNNLSTLYSNRKLNGSYYFYHYGGVVPESVISNPDVLVYVYVYPEVHDGYLSGFDWCADFVLKEYVEEYKEVRKELDKLIEDYPNTYSYFYDGGNKDEIQSNTATKLPQNDKYYLNYYIGRENDLFCSETSTYEPACLYQAPAYLFDMLTQKKYNYYEYVKKEGVNKLVLNLKTDTLYKPKYVVNFENK